MAAVACGFAASARGDVDPNSGIDFVRIGSVGNAPWPGNGQQGDTAIGRGSVGYEYSMGRLEVTTAQWCEFFNSYYDRSTPLNSPFVHAPAVWGAFQTAPTNAGGFRWNVPAGNENLPVGGISWRTAAMYCNWLNNNKSTDPSAFQNGAYDVSTFGDAGNGFNDQVTHNVNSRYWIPTWDEYIKAAHFDPNRNGANQPGYWIGPSTIGHLPNPGPPGTREANYGFSSPNPFAIPLGSYGAVRSAWGLLDASGGTSEWTEAIGVNSGQNVNRGYAGSYWGASTNASILDSIYVLAGESPGYRGYGVGFRVASSVPVPTTCIVLASACVALGARRRRG